MKTPAGLRSTLGVKSIPAKREMNVWFSFIKEIHADVDLISTPAGMFHFDRLIDCNWKPRRRGHFAPLFLVQNIQRNPRQLLARRKANSGYEIEICLRNQILARCSVNAGAKPFMKWTPGFRVQGLVKLVSSKTSSFNHEKERRLQTNLYCGASAS